MEGEDQSGRGIAGWDLEHERDAEGARGKQGRIINAFR